MERSIGDAPVTYGAVGATRDPHLLRYPPEGYRPLEVRARIGHGDERFAHASALALSWGIQRRSGFRVRREAVPSDSPRAAGDDEYSPLVAGETVTLVAPVLGRLGFGSPVRVIYVIDEPQQCGFACGTLPGHPVEGEESFLVDQRDDGSVWLTLRVFSRPAGRWWRVLTPVIKLGQWVMRRRYLRALSGRLER